MTTPRMHPQDIRALMAAIIYGQGLQLVGGAQWQNVNDHKQTVADVDAILDELKRTDKPAPWPLEASERVAWWTGRCAHWQERAEGAEARVAGLEEVANLRRSAYDLARSAAEDFRARAEGAEARVAELEAVANTQHGAYALARSEAESFRARAEGAESALAQAEQDIALERDRAEAAEASLEQCMAMHDQAKAQAVQAHQALLQLAGVAEEFLNEVSIPERNCSCHISPPCNDCVENSCLRETGETLQTAIKRIREQEPR